MLKTSPLVSVVVPTRNRPVLLNEALKSIVNQTYENLEIIVVNDGGNDVSHLMTDPRIIYFQHDTNRGPSAARNTALAQAKGQYICYLDDDDIYYPHHVATLVGALEKSGFSVAYSEFNFGWKEVVGNRVYTYTRKLHTTSNTDTESLLIYSNLLPICLMHKRECLELTGVFDLSLNYSEDWDLWIRLSRHFPFLCVSEVTAEYSRLEGGSQLTGKWTGNLLDSMQIIHHRYRKYASLQTVQSQEYLRYYKRNIAKLKLGEIADDALSDLHLAPLFEKLAQGSLLLAPVDVAHTMELGKYLMGKFPDDRELLRVYSRYFANRKIDSSQLPSYWIDSNTLGHSQNRVGLPL